MNATASLQTAPVPAAPTGGARDDIRWMIATLDALADMRALGAHSLFAGLYALTNRHLMAAFDRLAAPSFCHLVVMRFYELYHRQVVLPVLEGRSVTAPHWRAYASLAQRLTLDSHPDALRRLLALAARAHIRGDLAVAITRAFADHRAIHGHDPDLAVAQNALLGAHTSEAFFTATLAFNGLHRARETGGRRTALARHAAIARLTRAYWLAVLQSWRNRAWREALNSTGRGRGAAEGSPAWR